MSANSAGLSGRTFLITGANTGIGRATADDLARRGGKVFVACRSAEKGRAAATEIAAATGNDAVAFLPLDLADLASVRNCAAEFLARGEPLHVLINNAGVGGARGLTKDGFELEFGINHLGHFALTAALLDCLAASAPARVVTVSSDSHYQAKGIDFEAVRRPTASRTGLREYAVSKLGNVLFSAELGPPHRGARHHDLCAAPGRGRLRHLAAGPVAAAPADEDADAVHRAGRGDLAVLCHRAGTGGGDRPVLRQLPRAGTQRGRHPGTGR